MGLCMGSVDVVHCGHGVDGKQHKRHRKRNSREKPGGGGGGLVPRRLFVRYVFFCLFFLLLWTGVIFYSNQFIFPSCL